MNRFTISPTPSGIEYRSDMSLKSNLSQSLRRMASHSKKELLLLNSKMGLKKNRSQTPSLIEDKLNSAELQALSKRQEREKKDIIMRKLFDSYKTLNKDL